MLKAAERIEELSPAWIQPMHGGSLPQAAAHYYFDAPRDEPFAFDGRLFGKTPPGFPAPLEAGDGRKE